MNRTVVRHDFIDGIGKPGIKVTFYCENEPEALAVIAAGQSVPKPAAFVPALQAGPAFDSPEYSPQGVSAIYSPEGVSGGATPPPNCDGNAQFGHEPTQAGQLLAHAQHEAAVDGDDCTSGACLITRGSD